MPAAAASSLRKTRMTLISVPAIASASAASRAPPAIARLRQDSRQQGGLEGFLGHADRQPQRIPVGAAGAGEGVAANDAVEALEHLAAARL